jgi:hypothetical protein
MSSSSSSHCDKFINEMEVCSNFVRGTKLRKSFRVRHRAHQKIPPSALLYMKTLEVNSTVIAKISSPKLNKKMMKVNDRKIKDEKIVIKLCSERATEVNSDLMADESAPLLMTTRNVTRSSFRKKKKFNKFLSFFK